MPSSTSFVVSFLAAFIPAAVAFTGDLTYYTPGLGACGETSTSSQPVVALAPEHFTDSSSVCMSSISITRNGQTTQATVVDKCMGCDADSIDVSNSVFEQLANLAEGRVEVSWQFD